MDSPAIARRRVRLAVRDARLDKKLTQSEVAEAMEWSLSKVMRIESGEVTISPNDLRPLLEACLPAYRELAFNPPTSPHARFDVGEWVPLEV